METGACRESVKSALYLYLIYYMRLTNALESGNLQTIIPRENEDEACNDKRADDARSCYVRLFCMCSFLCINAQQPVERFDYFGTCS